MSFALCSSVTYALLYEKPKDIRTTLDIKAVRYATTGELGSISKREPILSTWGVHSCAIPNHTIHDGACEGESMFKSASFGAFLVVGGIHCIAWNFYFPTPLDQLLWRVSAIATTITMPLAMVLAAQGFYLVKVMGLNNRWSRSIDMVAGPGCVLIYITARAILAVQAIRLLTAQPPESFATTWTAGFPHFG